MPENDEQQPAQPTIRDLHAAVAAHADEELGRARRTKARPLAEAWHDLDTAMRAPVLDGLTIDPLPPGWGARLPERHRPIPDDWASMPAELGLWFIDGNERASTLYRLDQLAESGGLQTIASRRAKAVLTGLVGMLAEDLLPKPAPPEGPKPCPAADRNSTAVCDRPAGHPGIHAGGTTTWWG